MNDADKAYLLRASQGNFDPNFVPSDEAPEQPDIAPHELLNFAVPVGAAAPSFASQVASGALDVDHPTPAAPPAASPSFASQVTSGAVNVDQPTPAPAPPAEDFASRVASGQLKSQPASAPAPGDPNFMGPAQGGPSPDLVPAPMHQVGAAAPGAQAAGMHGILPLPAQAAKPPPTDYSGVEDAGAALVDAQTNLANSVASGNHDNAARVQQVVDAAAARLRETQKANEEAHKDLLNQRAAQETRWNLLQSREIDPDRYVHNMPAWNKALTLAAITLGGALEGFQGTPNRAMEAFDKARAADIDAQKMSFERDERVLQHGDNLYAQNYQLYRDDAAARAATDADMLHLQQWEFENLANNASNDVQKQQFLVAAAETHLKVEDQLARVGYQTATVKMLKARAEAQQLHQQVQMSSVPPEVKAQAFKDWQTGKISSEQYRQLAGQPVFNAQGAPPAASAAGGPAKPGAPPAEKGWLDAQPYSGKESDLHELGDGTWGVARGAENPATGMSPGHKVVNYYGKLVETTIPVDVPTHAQKAGAGPKAIRPNILIERNQMKQAVKDLQTVEPGMKFGEEGERNAERYNLIARSDIGRKLGLKEIDVSSSDLWDKNKGALIEAIGHLKRNHQAVEEAIDEARKQPGDSPPATSDEE